MVIATMLRDKWLTIVIVIIQLHTCLVYSFIFDIDTKNESACAGRCSYQYSLQCPLSQKIALRHLEYASKKVSETCPNEKESCQRHAECCSFDSRDCRIPFSNLEASSVYAKCSGKTECHDLRASQVSAESRCYERNFTNYVGATYSCVDDSTFVDICSNGTVYGKAVNLILNGSQPLHTGFKNSNLCACVISTSDCDSSARLRFQAIDVRLHQNQDITRCHPHSSFDITDGRYGSRPRSFRCSPNHFYRNFQDLYYSDKPYARISLYNKPELNISQLWLRVIATLPDIDVMVTCGMAAVYHASNNICVPPDFYPTTTGVYSTTTAHKILRPPAEDTGPNPGSIEEKEDLIPIIAGAVSAVIIVAIIIIIVICCRRKRRIKKKEDERFNHQMTVTSQPIPSPVENDYDNDYDGNYYDSVGNGRTFATSPFVQPVTPGKNMASFFPSEPKKISPPIVPVVPPMLPGNHPMARQSTITYDADANPYQQPWDGKPIPTPNRLKRNDLAYATSDEIQVLIQRMDNERRELNEGETCTSPSGFIHIDDYKLSQSSKEKTPQLEEDEEEEGEEEEEDDNHHLLGSRNNSRLHEDRHLEHVHIDPHDVMCSSEDTGYRSVGSQEQILVSEDDYLVPKTRKEDVQVPQRSSSQSEGKGDKSSNRSSASGDRSSLVGEATGGQYADVYDAVKDGKTVDVKTKF